MIPALILLLILTASDVLSQAEQEATTAVPYKIMKILELKVCQNTQNTPIVLRSFKQVPVDQFTKELKLVFNAKSTVKAFTKADLTFSKCNAKGKNCQKLPKFTKEGICESIDRYRANRGSNFFNPKIVCPLKKGRYTADNLVVDMRKLVGMGKFEEAPYWRAVLQVYNGRTKLFCLNTAFTVTDIQN